MLGMDRIMWGADYPHPEGTYPYTREALRVMFATVPQAECCASSGADAAKVHRVRISIVAPANREIRIGLIACPNMRAPSSVSADQSLLPTPHGSPLPPRSR